MVEEGHREGQAAEGNLYALLAALPDAALVLDADLRVRYLNPGAAQLLARSPDTVLGQRLDDLPHPRPVLGAWELAAQGVLHDGEPRHIAFDLPDVGSGVGSELGSARRFEALVTAQRDEEGTISRLVVITRDLTAVSQVELAVRKRSRELHELLDSSPDLIVALGPDLRVRFANAAFLAAAGRAVEQVVGRRLRALFHSGTGLGAPRVWAAATERSAQRVLASGVPEEIEVSWDDPAGERHWTRIRCTPRRGEAGSASGAETGSASRGASGGEASAVAAVLLVGRDITEQRRREEQLVHQSLHDPLTGLANRILLLDRLGQLLRALPRGERPGLLVFIDLDGFKDVNDSHGHTVGDHVLREIGARLTSMSRVADTVARVGGDEFVVLFTGADEPGAEPVLLERLRAVFAQPIGVDGLEFGIRASFGVVPVDDASRTPGEVLDAADQAMYAEKRRHRL